MHTKKGILCAQTRDSIDDLSVLDVSFQTSDKRPWLRFLQKKVAFTQKQSFNNNERLTVTKTEKVIQLFLDYQKRS